MIRLAETSRSQAYRRPSTGATPNAVGTVSVLDAALVQAVSPPRIAIATGVSPGRVGRVSGQDLAIGFHGVGLSEAWSVLDPYIRRERQNRGMRYAVFYEDLVCRVRARPPRRYTGVSSYATSPSSH
jgi:hypothetical protein